MGTLLEKRGVEKSLVDAKKVEKKIPILIAPWYSKEYDIILYRMEQFKRKAPEKCMPKINRVVFSITDFELSLEQWWLETHKKRNTQH